MPMWLTMFLALGGSTLIACIVNGIFNGIMNGTKARKRKAEEYAEAVDRKNEILKCGVQALLRHDLNEIYDTWVPRGYCPNDVKVDFENMFTQYHQLGKNGVMDNKHNVILSLPDTPTKQTLNENK